MEPEENLAGLDDLVKKIVVIGRPGQKGVGGRQRKRNEADDAVHKRVYARQRHKA
jgi:hypothetical protein